MIAGVFAIALFGERRVNKQLREHFDGEEERNSDSYDAGVRNGQLFAELGVSYLGDYREPNFTLARLDTDTITDEPSIGAVYVDGTTDNGWGGHGGHQHTPELSTPQDAA